MFVVFFVYAFMRMDVVMTFIPISIISKRGQLHKTTTTKQKEKKTCVNLICIRFTRNRSETIQNQLINFVSMTCTVI